MILRVFSSRTSGSLRWSNAHFRFSISKLLFIFIVGLDFDMKFETVRIMGQRDLAGETTPILDDREHTCSFDRRGRGVRGVRFPN